jgi:tetratricopeptide (TPR) repeat protein
MASRSDIDRAQVFFVTGNEASKKGNYDYAVQMFLSALKIDPKNIPYRQALRATQRMKFGNEPAKVGRMAGLKTQGTRSKAKGLNAKGQHAQALELLEEAFSTNPWDLNASMEAAEAALGLDAQSLARWLMESVLPQGRESPEFLRELSLVYRACKEHERAVQCLEMVRRIKPTPDIDTEIKHILAEQAIRHTQKSKPASLADDGEGEGDEEEIGVAPAKARAGAGIDPGAAIRAAAHLPNKELDKLRGENKSPEQLLLDEIEQHPKSVGSYLRAADHYREKGKLEQAEKVLAQGLKVLPADETLQNEYAEVQIARLRKAQQDWAARAKANPADAQARTNAGRLKAMLEEYELKDLRRRAAANPGDPQLQYQFGTTLARLGLHDEAIKAFQVARNSLAHRVQAMHQAGLSFEAKGMLKLAERSYQDALKVLDPGDAELFKELHYQLGLVAEAQGNIKGAEEHYTEVANLDYDYKDIAARIQSLNS